mgnify:CR=1 FL=1
MSVENLSELIDLSLVEIITIQRLLQHTQPVVRYVLYQEINQLIFPSMDGEEAKDVDIQEISTNKFYNNILSKLEKKGLLKFTLDAKDHNQKKVEATKKAGEILNKIFRNILIIMVDDLDYITKVANRILKTIEKDHFETLLYTMINEDLNIQLMELLSMMSNEFYLISSKRFYKNMKKIGIENIKSTQVLKQMIREPNDVFEIALSIEYIKDLEYFGLDRLHLLKELHRVVKPGGNVIITTIAKIPKQSNYIIQSFLKIYKKANKGRFFTIKEVEKDFKEAGFSKIEVFEDHGIIIGIGWV